MKLPRKDALLVKSALRVMERHMTYGSCQFSTPDVVKDFLTLKLRHLEHEVFSIIFLDSQHKMLEYKEMFRGTLTQTSVYPREVAKHALMVNAAAVILAHNHPSGEPKPSRADELLTQTLKSSLALVDVRVLDHFIIGQTVYSMAEYGLI